MWSCKIKNSHEFVGLINLPDVDPGRAPDHEDCIDLWSPLLGDREHLVHSTGTQRFWYTSPDELRSLVPDGYENVLGEIARWCESHPGHWWVLVEDARTHARVAKTDPAVLEAIKRGQ